MRVRGRGADFGRTVRVGAAAVLCLALANCSASDKFARKVDPKYGVSASPRVVGFGEPVPKGGGTYRVGKPYQVAGRTYVPEDDRDYRAEGVASWYGHDFHGRLTANGEVFDMESITAAHPTLPMPSYVRVTNLANGRSIVARVNDRGPYHGNRVIDVSIKTAQLLGFHSNGIGRVRVEYVGPAALEGSDDRKLAATLRQRGEQAPAPSPVVMASARPFVPEMRSPLPARGAVPVPAARPYTLGEDAPSLASAGPSTELTAVGRTQILRSGLPEPDYRSVEPAGRMTSPQSAYAPARQDPIATFMSGRGLY
jgi:rare lipoprotein A